MSADLIGDDACREAFNKARQQRFSVHGLDVVCEPDIFRSGYAAGRDSEIAKRDARMAELEKELQAGATAVENCELFRAELAAIKAQEPDCDRSACGDFSPGPCDNPDCSARRDRMVGAPAAKAQGVVMPEGWIPLTIEHEPGYPEDVAFGPKRMMDRLKKWLDRYFEMRLNAATVQQVSVPAWMASSRAFADRLYMAGWRDHADAQHSGAAGMYDELLAAAPVQKVSVPDGFERYRLANKFCEQRLVTDDHVRAIVVDAFASGYGFGIAASPAAPAADAWIPVGERLPEPGEPVQVWCEGAEQPGLAWISRHADWSGEWVIPEPQAIGYESITHWMPLPSGPAAHGGRGV